jgi:hypothetical protein
MPEPIRINATLAALLSSAFLAWAGLVWSQSSRILTLAQEIHADLRQLEERQANHEKTPYHSAIPNLMQKVEEHNESSAVLMATTRSRLERLERDHQKAMEPPQTAQRIRGRGQASAARSELHKRPRALHHWRRRNLQQFSIDGIQGGALATGRERTGK